VALLLLVPPAVASAAEVARVEGASLHASDQGRQLCVELRSDGGGHKTCGEPFRPYRAMAVTLRGHVAGAVPAAAARVEAELADGRRVGAETLGPGTYAGRSAGRARFFLFAVPGRTVLLRLHDAAGALIGAVEVDRFRGPPAAGSELLLEQRRGGRAITARGMLTRVFAPTPLAVDRTETRPCLRVRGPSGGSLSCGDPAPDRPVLDLAVQHGCGALRSVLHGFVGDAVDEVRVKLGSGRRLRVPVRTLFGERRYVAAVLPRGEAVRRARAAGARQELGERPGGLPCVPHSGSAVAVYAPARAPSPALAGDGAQVAAALGEHRLLVRDADEDRMCAGIDRVRRCLLPPVDPQLAQVARRDGLVAAVLPAEVARVRLPDGNVVPTVPGEAYDGRYAGRVRFLLARSPRGRLAFLDAQGDELAVTPGGERPEPTAGPVTLARGDGWRLRAERHGEVACLGMTRRCQLGLLGFPSAYADVRCGRRPLLWGAAPARQVAAILRGGRILPARVLRLPRRLGRGRAFVLELPRRAEVVALRFGAERVRFPLPPAGRQCGYAVFEPALAS
jgi:hypothetical protein